jgi:hypothetical protein
VALFLIIVAAVLQAGVSAEAKLVWGAICFLARPRGVCISRYREIGALVGLNKRAVMRAISELTNAGLIGASGGGNGVARTFSVPVHLVQDMYHFGSDTGARKEPVGRQHRSRNGSGPLLIMNWTATESAPPYKEEKNNNNKSASEDAGTSLSLPKLQQKWFEDEFWPSSGESKTKRKRSKLSQATPRALQPKIGSSQR